MGCAVCLWQKKRDVRLLNPKEALHYLTISVEDNLVEHSARGLPSLIPMSQLVSHLVQADGVGYWSAVRTMTGNVQVLSPIGQFGSSYHVD